MNKIRKHTKNIINDNEKIDRSKKYDCIFKQVCLKKKNLQATKSRLARSIESATAKNTVLSKTSKTIIKDNNQNQICKIIINDTEQLWKNDTALNDTSIEYNKWHLLYVAAMSFGKASRRKANYTSLLVATCPSAQKYSRQVSL